MVCIGMYMEYLAMIKYEVKYNTGYFDGEIHSIAYYRHGLYHRKDGPSYIDSVEGMVPFIVYELYGKPYSSLGKNLIPGT